MPPISVVLVAIVGALLALGYRFARPALVGSLR